MRFFRRAVCLLAAMLFVSMAHAETLKQSGGSRWVVIGSRSTMVDALSLAQAYPASLPLRVVRAQNGWFAVLLGPEQSPDLVAIKARYALPADALLSSGERYVETVWRSDQGANPKEAYKWAQKAFASQSLEARVELQQLMTAAGYWASVSNEDFSRRLFDAITRFQRENGFSPNGVLSQEQRERLRSVAQPALTTWRLTALAHPATGKVLWIPQGFGLEEVRQDYGSLLRSGKVTVMYAYFPNAAYDVALERLTSLMPNQVIDYKVAKPDFFVVVAHTDTTNSYSRFHVYGTGLLGFTLAWSNEDGIYGDRLATIMSDLFRSTVALSRNWAPPTPSGFASTGDAAALSYRPAGSSYPAPSAPDASVIQAAIDADNAKKDRVKRLKDQLSQTRQQLEATLVEPLPSATRDLVVRTVDAIKAVIPSGSEDVLIAQARSAAAAKTDVDGVIAVAKATSAKNAFVLSGDPGDVLVFYNESGKAPSVVKNMKGDLVFESDRTSICQIGVVTPDRATLRVLNERFQRWGQAVRPPLPACDVDQLQAYDLVILGRADLQKAAPADVVRILSAVDAGALSTMFTVTASQSQETAQSEAGRASEIERTVNAGSGKGSGFLLLQTGSATVCQSVTPDPEISAELGQSYLGRLDEELKARPVFAPTNADAAFVSAKRGQCGMLWASAADLKDLSAALLRDGLPFQFLPIWVDDEQLEKARATVLARRTSETEAQADERRRKEDQARLNVAKEQDASVVREKRQAELQRQYGAPARAFEGALAAELKTFTDGQPEPVAGKYPMVAEWWRRQLDDRWELMSVDTRLLDYGVSEFKGRSLDTGFAETSIKMRNRLLGEYRTTCFVTGYVADHEFGVDREPVAVECEAAAPILDKYRQGARYTSRWLAP